MTEKFFCVKHTVHSLSYSTAFQQSKKYPYFNYRIAL